MSHSNSNSGGCLPGIIIFLIICYIIGAVSDSGKHTCYYIGCDREVDKNESPIMLQHRQRLNLIIINNHLHIKQRKRPHINRNKIQLKNQQHPVIINIPVLHPVILRQLRLHIPGMFTTPTMMDMMTYMTIWEIMMKIDMMKMTIIGTV